MTTVVELLKQLRQRDIRVWVENDRLRVNAPKGAIDDALKSELSQRKLEIIAHLNSVDLIRAVDTLSLIPVDRSSPPPLSFTQQRLWFLDQLEPGTAQFNMPIALRLTGALDVAALQASLQKVVERHEMLRTTFMQVNGRPVQKIHTTLPIEIEQIDLRQFAADERVEIANNRMKAEIYEPFDLEVGPLVRVKLYVLNEAEYIILFNQHHIITDGWSTTLMWRELTAVYNELVTGTPAALPELPIQYGDYSVWQQNWLESDGYQAQLDYWQKKMRGTLPTLDLPLDRSRAMNTAANGAALHRKMPADLMQGIKQLGRAHGATLFMTVLTAFKALLYRYTGQEDLLIGTSIANRNRAETSSLIGFFVNTLLLRTDISEQPSFADLLDRVRKVAMEAFANQDMPVEKLIELLQPERDSGRANLFDVLFIFQNTPEAEGELANVKYEYFPIKFDRALFDLTWYAMEQEDGLEFLIEYNADLFDEATIERLFVNFQKLLESIVAAPAEPIAQLPLLPAQELDVLDEWRQTQSVALPAGCVHEWFEAQVAANPGKTAVSHSSQHLTYAKLNAKANQLAHYLIEKGVQPDSIVGLHMPRSIEMIVALLGVLKAGGAYLPLDPDYPAHRLQYMLEDARPLLVLTADDLSFAVDEDALSIVKIAGLDQFNEYSVVNPKTAVSTQNLAYIIYTSGSTGKPKGVQIEHQAMANFVHGAAVAYPITSEDRVLQFATIAFDTAVEEIYPCLTQGATLVLRTETMIDTMDHFLAKCAEWNITVLDLPTAFWHHLTISLVTENLSLPPNVKLVIIGGEKANEQAMQQWQEQVNADVRLLNTYGPTEATVVTTMYEASAETSVTVSKGMLIGRPLPNYDVYVLDAAMQPVPIGVAGELLVGGPGLSRGYLNRFDLTVERFVESPFGNGRLYKTGDLVRFLPDGNLEFMGRTDDQVKIRGYRIELGEIEAALTQHDQVQQAVVIAYEPTETDRQLAAYLIGDGEIVIEDIHQHLQDILPAYMVPASFTVLDALPLMPNGKVDRKALPEPDQDSVQAVTVYVAPRTPVESELAAIWAEVLKVEQVGIHDDFFMLGGHSLLATSVISRIRQVFPVDLPLRALFDKPTVAGLAQEVAEGQDSTHSSSIPIVPVDRDNEILMSFAQQRLWFLDQLEPGSTAYNLPIAMRLKGPLDVAALDRSLQLLVNRHEVLRSTFVQENGRPIQKIHPSFPIKIEQVDLTSIPPSNQVDTAMAQIDVDLNQPFDLANGPLLRVKLFLLNETDHIMLFTQHHIITDYWSTVVMWQELTTIYKDIINNRPISLPQLSIQYADYAQWQREWMQGDVLETQLTYWKNQLAGNLPVLELPIDHPRPVMQTHPGTTQTFVLSETLTNSLKALSQQENTTLFITLLAAFNVLLHRYTGKDDINVGSPIAGRSRAELEDLIGFFVNTLVLRTDLSGNPSFRDLLGRVHEAALGAYANQDVPFEKLVEAIQPARDTSHSPLFQVMFALQNAPSKNVRMNELTMEGITISNKTAMFDLSLTMDESEEGLLGALEYNTDLFDEATITRLIGNLQILLESIVAHSDQPIAELPLLTTSEQNKILVEWNETLFDYPRGKRIHQLIESQAEIVPDAVAVMQEQEQLTYRQLNERANQLAHFLQQLGVGPDVIVGLSIPRSVDMIVSLLAVLKAGGAYLPLDPSYPVKRLQFMVEDAKPAAILTQNDVDWVELCGDSVAIINLSDWQTFAKYPTHNLNAVVASQDLAYIIYTSGSTGVPKGVQIEHGAMANFVHGAIETYGMRGEDRVLQFATIAFDTAVEEIYPILTLGGRLVLRTDTMIDTMSHFLEKCGEWGVTILDLPTAFWHHLTNSLVTENLSLPPCVKMTIIGGEKANEQVLHQWQQHVGPNVNLFNGYGPTEATVAATVYKAGSDLDAETVSRGMLIGKPMPNYDVYVLDAAMQPVPIGVAGELLIGGESLARGYLNRPELTEEKFIQNPFGAGRLYCTGDLVRFLPDGNIEFMGRTDDQVKIRGYRIEMGEIEAALTKYPQVKQSVVIAYEPMDGDKQLAAYLEVETGIAVDDIHDYLQDSLPAYMVPASFTMLDAFPMMPNGKVDRKALPEPDRSAIQVANVYIAPRTPVETDVAAIWAEVLNVEQVGIHDDFFMLGGHSLLATSVVSRIRQTFEIELPLRELFDKPTVLGLSQVIETSQAVKSDVLPIVPVERNGHMPLSYAQKRFWILDQMEQGGGIYNIPQATRIRGPLNGVVLAESLTRLVARHEILRTTYTSVEGDPYQVIHDAVPIQLQQIDISHAHDKEQKADDLVKIEANASFDLSKDWPIRTKLVRMGADDHIFMVTMHHIASDGWSFGVFMRELTDIYQSLVNGKVPALSLLPVQYADYAAWQDKVLGDGETAISLTYWKEQLSDNPDPLEFPTDFNRPAVRSFNGSHVERTLPDDVSQHLHQFCQEESATLFMALLATFKLVLHRYTGQEDILVGSPFAGRNRPELEEMIGLFLNTIVLRTDLSGKPTYRKLVQRVRDVSLSAFAHQEIPFEMILEELKVERDLSRTPLFQVFFNVLNFEANEQDFGELTFEGITNPGLDSKFDLTLYVGESEKDVGLYLVYNKDLFTSERMNLFVDHFMQVLQQAVVNPDRPITEFSLLTEAERKKILVEWNDTAVSKTPTCFQHLFEEQAAKTPDAIALTFNDIHLSYDALNRRANQLAHLLRNKYGVAPGKLVAIGVERSLEMVSTILGVLKAGGAYVPLDPTHPQARLNDILEDTQAPILITQERPLQNMPPFTGEIIHLDHMQTSLDKQPDTNPEPLATLDDLAYVVYTSGSTGKPKGVLVHHRGVAHHLTFLRQNYGVNEKDVVIQIPTVSFDASVRDTFTPLISGGRVVIISALDLADPMVVAAKMQEQKVTAILSIVPSLLVRLLEAAAKMDWTDHSMRMILTSGEALFMSYCHQAKEIFGAELEVVNQYGPTECTMTSSYYRVENMDTDRKFALIGRPVANTQIYLLDKQLKPVPVGVPGEIHIGGMEITYGYLNRPELTAEKFIADPYSDRLNARLYKTGDLGRFLPDGTIEFIGRSDKQVKLRGYRVELGEVEVALLRNPSVKEAVVVAHESAPGDLQLVAYLVAKDGADDNSLSQRALRDSLLDQLPAYMVPANFMVIDSIPLNPNGKINYKALPSPEITYDGTDRQYVAPRNDVEEVVSMIIAETLNLEKVSVVDNFFEMGGHSLLVTKVLFRIMDSFQIDFPLWRFFEDPTAAGAAAKILSANPGQEVRIKRTAQLLIKLSKMSDEEVAQMLQSRK